MFLDWGDGWKSVNDHAEDVAALAGFSIQWGTDDLAEQPEPSASPSGPARWKGPGQTG